jgi:peptidoglycan hydrolase-like protein with peptidoglycan-binding domain
VRLISLRVGIVAGVTVLVALVSLVGYGYVWGFDNPPSATAGTSASTLPVVTPVRATSTTSSSTTSTTAAPTTTTQVRVKNPPPVAMPAVPANGLGVGSSGPDVQAFQQRLADLHFDPGAINGRYSQDTMYAVTAVQKLWSLPRTGRIDNNTRFVISHFKYPTPLNPTGPATRVEIDLNKQVLVVWDNNQVRLITTISTGGGYYFCGGDSGCQYAVTPPGVFHFTRYVSGWKKSKLGELWNPFYFNGGIAVHGYPEVPAYPASHGCTRIPMDLANYFHTLVSVGEEVDVVGKAAGPPPGFVPPPPTTAAPTTTATVAPAITTAPKSTTTKPPVTTTPTTHPVTTTTH